MRALVSAFILCILHPAAFAAPVKPTPAPVVKVESGQLRGELHGTAAVFSGIPYAAPPVGALRWREPQPVAAWKGVRDATKLSGACVQNPAGLESFFAPMIASYGATDPSQHAAFAVSSSEDCLYLNIWAPQWPVKSALPVMVWLHGGSNRVGSGTESSYNGASMASRGVIVVTVNYRLGVMGFFAHPDLTAESPHHSSSNYGLLDQLAALKWVKQNIAQFGGDPGNVTLFGESAGAIDSGMLLASPLSTGLFRRVISESGPPFGLGQPHTLAEAQSLGVAIASAAHGTSASALQNLRNLPATEVVQLAADVLKTQTQFKGLDTNSPIIDGWFLPQAPARIFATGAMQKADLLVGVNGREFSAFRLVAAAAAKASPKDVKPASASSAMRTMADQAGPLYGNWTDFAIVYYLGKMLMHHEAGVDQAANDMFAACPIGALGTLVTAAGQKTYIYQFDRSVPGKGEADLGAFHSLEIPYVFNAFEDPIWRWLPFTQADHNLSQVMQTYWTNFARTGDPNGPGLPSWPVWTNAAEPYMDFDHAGQAVPQHDFSPPFCHLAPERIKRQLTGN
jgi:para-nitrobenzyl esterase